MQAEEIAKPKRSVHRRFFDLPQKYTFAMTSIVITLLVPQALHSVVAQGEGFWISLCATDITILIITVTYLTGQAIVDIKAPSIGPFLGGGR